VSIGEACYLRNSVRRPRRGWRPGGFAGHGVGAASPPHRRRVKAPIPAH